MKNNSNEGFTVVAIVFLGYATGNLLAFLASLLLVLILVLLPDKKGRP